MCHNGAEVLIGWKENVQLSGKNHSLNRKQNSGKLRLLVPYPQLGKKSSVHEATVA